MVTNTKPFERYEDHEAALYIQLHEMVEHAFAKGEDPIALIEDYLELVYTEGKSVAEIADFLARLTRCNSHFGHLKKVGINWMKAHHKILYSMEMECIKKKPFNCIQKSLFAPI